MSDEIIVIPRRLDFPEAISVIGTLAKYKDVGSLAIDFRQLHFARPFGTLYLGTALRKLMFDRQNLGYQTQILRNRNLFSSASGVDNYLNFMQFWQFIEGKVTSRPIKQTKDKRYMSLTVIQRKDLESGEFDVERLQNSISNRALELSQMLTGVDGTAKNQDIAYLIREILRNVFEHSGANECYMYGQKYGTGKDYEIELTIADLGLGIPKTIIQNQLITVADEYDALNKALQPGISRIGIAEDNQFQNSGFGLFVVSEVGKSLGDFILCSGNSGLKFENKQLQRLNCPNLQGTVLRILVKRPKGKNLGQIIDDIIKEGEAVVKSDPKRHSPSPLSKKRR